MNLKPFDLTSSKHSPDPKKGETWYHHHAPLSQTFGDYICVKKSTMKELGQLFRQAFS